MHVHAIIKVNNEFYDIISALPIRFLLWSMNPMSTIICCSSFPLFLCLSIFLTWQPKPLLKIDAMWSTK
jgi:hypothetical protein